jgi:Na+/proline symporter
MDIVNDFVERIQGRGLDERQLLLLSRLVIILFGLLALAFALKFRGVIHLLLFGYSIYTAGLVIPAVFGFWRQKFRLNPTGALVAMIGGGGWVILRDLGLVDRLGFEGFLDLSPGFQGVLLSLILLFAGSYVSRSKRIKFTEETRRAQRE